MITSGRAARTSEARPDTAVVFMVMVLILFLRPPRWRPVSRDIGATLGYCTLPLLHYADFKEVIAVNSHYEGVILRDLHASEQYLTVSQFFAHFFRQVNGRPHATQGLDGRSPLATAFPPLRDSVTRRPHLARPGRGRAGSRSGPSGFPARPRRGRLRCGGQAS